MKLENSKLNVVLIHRDNWYRNLRIDGQFAYPTDEFSFVHYPVNKSFKINLTEFQGQFDIVWWDEGKYKGELFFYPEKPKHPVKVVSHFMYTTLKDSIFRDRLRKANKNADLVLLDYDRLSQWEPRLNNIPVDRCAYSVNEKYYYPREKEYDVCFLAHWKYNPEREKLDNWLTEFCNRKGYKFISNRGKDIETEYAEILGKSKVAIHMNRTPETRPARIFDCAASKTALLSNPMPEVSGEEWKPYIHYIMFYEPTSIYDEVPKEVKDYTDNDCKELVQGLELLLDENYWEFISDSAYKYVMENHTWQQRSKQLRNIFNIKLGL